MIPKTIHYCWFGGNPKPKLAEKCIKSWRKYCPDYEIIEWNETVFNVSTAPLYVRQAYNAGKWAFVTDYVRLYAMVNYGGIYMDTDVEVIRPLDTLLAHQAFSGFEDEHNIPTGIMAAEKGFPLFVFMLHYYDYISFIKPDGTYNLTTNVKTITEICKTRGLMQNNTFQIVDGFAIYPKDVFCPYDLDSGKVKKTNNTFTIHWFSGSWLSEEQLRQKKLDYRQHRREERKGRRHMLVRKVLGDQLYEQLKKKVGRA